MKGNVGQSQDNISPNVDFEVVDAWDSLWRKVAMDKFVKRKGLVF